MHIVHAYMRFIQDNAERAGELLCTDSCYYIAAYLVAVREMLIDLSLKRGLPRVGKVAGVDFMDDGSPIRLEITIDRRYLRSASHLALTFLNTGSEGSALFDFTGSGSQVYGNWCVNVICNLQSGIELAADRNAPVAICYSAIIFCLRCLVRRDIPLNQGTLTYWFQYAL